MSPMRLLFALFLLLQPVASLHVPGSTRPIRRTVATRRSVAFGLPLAAAAAALRPQSALAACSCPKGFDSCVCTDDEPTNKKSSVNQKRADAAGREAITSKQEIAQMRAMYDDAPIIVRSQQPKLGRSSTSASAKKETEARPTIVSVQPDFVGLSGGGSLNYGEIDKNEARQRFLKILSETVDKREAEYGFELDANDIKQIESVLRVKYCGPQGLIGPC